MREEFSDLNLTFSIGGQISFDLFPTVRALSPIIYTNYFCCFHFVSFPLPSDKLVSFLFDAAAAAVAVGRVLLSVSWLLNLDAINFLHAYSYILLYVFMRQKTFAGFRSRVCLLRCVAKQAPLSFVSIPSTPSCLRASALCRSSFVANLVCVCLCLCVCIRGGTRLSACSSWVRVPPSTTRSTSSATRLSW